MLLAVAALLAVPQFNDRSADFGISLGTGAACWVDLDNDGWQDLVAGGFVWRNKEGKGFEKHSPAGDSVAADFDNDGYTDLFSWQQMKLLRNSRGKGFLEYPLPQLPKTVSRGAAWADLNNDGFVDLYIGGYEGEGAYPSLVLMNQGGKGFVIASSTATHRTRGVTACDFDRDGDMDVYASNYRLQPNQLFVNDGKGTLSDQAAARGAVATSPGFNGGHSIGAAWGDFDNDGEIDLFAGNFAHVDSRGDQPKSRFLRNLGPRGGYKFEDKGASGVYYQESYATPSAADFDNDGLLDVHFTTVYMPASFGRANHPVLFRNTGNFAFVDFSKEARVDGLPPTYQSAWADYDRDGDLDLVSGGKLFENQGSGGAWLQLRLVGDGRTVNRDAIGAQVRITAKGKTFTRQVEAGTGEGNQNQLVLHVGLGDATDSVDADITWPGGRVQKLHGLRLRRHHEIRFDEKSKNL